MSATEQASPAAPGTVLAGMLAGAWLAQAIAAAARFRIADLLHEGPRSPEDLAAASGTQAGPLRRVLRALAGSGIFVEGEDGRFGLTPLAEPLRSDVPASLRAYAEMVGSMWAWGAFGAIDHTLRTGEPGFDHLFGAPVFEFYRTHPEAARLSVAGLASIGRAQDAAILAAYDFRHARTVVDVGAGAGALLRAILSAAPAARGILMDLPHVVELARPSFASDGLADRAELRGGDFFASVPAGGDLYLLRKVIHDWDDARARTILRRCREAMHPGSRLLVVEAIVPEGNGYSYAKLLDLLMLVYAGGQERSLAEYRTLLASADLQVSQVIPTTSAVSIIEALPAGTS